MAAQIQVLGLIDNAHASAAKLAQYAVVGDCLTDHCCPWK
jgi:hypothetical protein